LVLAEKGVEAKWTLVAAGPPTCETYEPWYMRLNPGGTVPTLVDGERVVADSREILSYVDAHFEGPALVPADADARAAMEELVAAFYELRYRDITYGSGKMAKGGAKANGFRLRNLIRRRAKAEASGDAELAAIYAAKQRDIEAFIASAGDASGVAAALAELDERLDELDARLREGGPLLCGEAYTLADVVWTVCLARLHMLDHDPLAGRPALAEWYASVRARPSFDAADVWERMKPGRMVKMLLTKLWPQLLVILALLTGLVWLLAWLVTR
jgi:glutathione S-transferase